MARVMINKPKIVLLDEPLAALDPIVIQDIQKYIMKIQSTGTSILITDHNVRETLGICDRAYILSSGHIIEQGDPEAITENPRVRQVYLGENFNF